MRAYGTRPSSPSWLTYVTTGVTTEPEGVSPTGRERVEGAPVGSGPWVNRRVREQRPRRRWLPGRPGVGQRSRPRRDPGVVGPRAPHQRRLRPLRRRGLRRPRARPLPRRLGTTEPDEAGKLMMALNIDQAVQGHGRRRRLPARPATPSPPPTSASSASAWVAAWPWRSPAPGPTRSAPAPRSTASSRGPTSSPTGRSSTPPCSATSPRTTDSSPRRWSASSRHAAAGLGKEAEFIIHPGADHAFFNDTRPEVHDPAASAKAWASVVPFLKANIT